MRVLVHLPERLQDEDEEDGEQHIEVHLSLRGEHGQEAGSEELLPPHRAGQGQDQQEHDGDLQVQETGN